MLFLDVVDRFPADLSDLGKLASFLREFTGFLYLGMFFTVTIPLYDMILVCKYWIKIVPLEKELVLKEVKSRMYSLELYFAIKLLIEVPSVLISTWITTTIVFFIVGLEATFSNWFLYGMLLFIVKRVGLFCYSICWVPYWNHHGCIGQITSLRSPGRSLCRHNYELICRMHCQFEIHSYVFRLDPVPQSSQLWI